MTVATQTAVEVLHFDPESGRTQQWFQALETAGRAHGINVVRTTKYQGSLPWLLLWGPGAPGRLEIMNRHVSRGGHAIVMDLAYWDRDRKARVSFDAPHPQAWIMRTNLPATRFKAERITVDNRWKETGPVIIAGLGEKARVQYGAASVDHWEHQMMQECHARWPKRRILYRKKKVQSAVPGWADESSGQEIDTVLTGVSLVVTWHSNVAVDAIRLGIPVICQDGAAAAVCPSALGEADPQPLDPAVRDQFLWNLSYFQWAPTEAKQFWVFMQERLA